MKKRVDDAHWCKIADDTPGYEKLHDQQSNTTAKEQMSTDFHVDYETFSFSLLDFSPEKYSSVEEKYDEAHRKPEFE